MKSLPVLLIWVLIAAVLYGGYFALSGWLGLSGVELAREYTTDVFARRVAKVADDLPGITRVKLTPDEKWLLATTIDGKVWGFANDNGRYVRQETPVWQIDTGWDVGQGNGMTGLVASYDFEFDKTIFVSLAARQSGERGENQIWRVELEEVEGRLQTKTANVIFRGNTSVLGTHQIHGMTTIPVEDSQHILFAIGDGGVPEHARNLEREAGKIMLIQIDGSNPLGARPYPRYPRIQAIGIRDVYDVSVYLPTAEVYFADRGPEVNDRVIIAPLFSTRQFDFGWDGEPGSMLKVLENGEAKSQYIVQSWDAAVAPVDIVADSLGRFILNIFSTTTHPRAEVALGEKVDEQWELTTVAERAEGIGNILGIALSFQTGTIYFGDPSEGAIYGLGRPWEIKRLQR